MLLQIPLYWTCRAHIHSKISFKKVISTSYWHLFTSKQVPVLTSPVEYLPEDYLHLTFCQCQWAVFHPHHPWTPTLTDLVECQLNVRNICPTRFIIPNLLVFLLPKWQFFILSPCFHPTWLLNVATSKYFPPYSLIFDVSFLLGKPRPYVLCSAVSDSLWPFGL